VEDLASGVFQDDEAVEDPAAGPERSRRERGRGHDEEIDGSDLRGVIFQEGPPCHGRFLATAVDVFPDGGGRDGVAEQRQDLLDYGRPPEWIGTGDLTDETPECGIDLGSSRASSSAC